MRSQHAGMSGDPGLSRALPLIGAGRALLAVVAALLGLGLGLSCACAAPQSSLPGPSASASGASVSSAPRAGAAASASAVAAGPASGATAGPEANAVPGVPAGAESCGELGCLLFATPADAFGYVVAQKPLVLALGESHAQKGAEAVASCTKHFTTELLPLLKDRASDLVVELWVADGKCGKVETQVAEQQKPVTQHQAATNQNEFVTLGTRAKELGIRPLPLRPSCEEYERIAKAGPSDVAEMLMMIARHTEADIRRLLTARAADAEPKMIVAYGGAMHNDLYPTEERKAWSFGPALSAATTGRYVELDLVVPELIGESDTWKSFVWYPHFDPKAHPTKTTLFRPRPGSYVLIFPRGKPSN